MLLFTSEVISFCVVYAICALIMVYTFRAKKTSTLPLAIVYSFVGAGFWTLLNLILELTISTHSFTSFYQVSIGHFVGVALTINLWMHWKKKKEEKPEVG